MQLLISATSQQVSEMGVLTKGLGHRQLPPQHSSPREPAFSLCSPHFMFGAGVWCEGLSGPALTGPLPNT